jgi:serine phosphatase RsbU (regulator of sigma subunit)
LYPVRADRSAAGAIAYIVATGSDITDAVATRAERERRMQIEAEVLRQGELARRHELELVTQAEVSVRERLARLAGAALDMVGAQSIEDLTAILFSRGVPVLGADGGALILKDPDGLLVAARDRVHGRGEYVFRRVPADGPLPGPYVARTGERIILPSRAAGIEFAAEMATVYEETDRRAAAVVPLKIGDRVLGALAIFWVDEREISADDIALIEAFAAQCAQTIERINVTAARVEATREVQRMAESMQASLLTRPPSPDDVEVAALYRPAVRQLRVGGDWHDAFAAGSGDLVLSIGDVAGHDGDSVATMAQLRSILRGLAVDSEDLPAALLGRLDHAIEQLSLDAIVTALVARVDRSSEARRGAGVGELVVHWSSAGHPPPLVRLADGTVEVLASVPELLLGVDPAAPRHDHRLLLPNGAILLLYTDGLIERRNEVIGVGIDRLSAMFAGLAATSLREMCPALAEQMLPDGPDDDVAMLAIRSTH